MLARIIILALVLGAFFGIIGGAMAYLIIYREYKKHFTELQMVIKESFRAAVITFLVLLGGSLLAGLVVYFIILKK